MIKTINIQRIAWGTVIFLFIAPPVIGILYLLVPVAPACPANPLSDPDSLLIGVAMIAVLWLLGTFVVIWLRKNRSLEAYNRRYWKAATGIAFCLLLAGAATTYTSLELADKYDEVGDRLQLVGQNVARTIYESYDYNAFPKVLMLANGSLWCVWYRANDHVDSNNDGKLVQSFSNNNGTSWTAPVVIADDPSYDTRNPALGQLVNGTLVLMYFLYDSTTGLAVCCDWISSNDGLSWSPSREINSTQYNPEGETRFDWLSPFGNMFDMGGHEVAAFYGGLSSLGEAGNSVILLEFTAVNSSWRYYTTPMAAGQRGYNEANIQWTGDRWLCVARTSEKRLYHAYSLDGVSWSTPKGTPYALGHAPDIAVLETGIGMVDMFCAYRGDRGFLRGGLARYDTTTDTFWCEHAILYTTQGRGGGDSGYASVIRFSNASVGFVNYDVIDCCGSSGCDQMRGLITWQDWVKN